VIGALGRIGRATTDGLAQLGSVTHLLAGASRRALRHPVQPRGYLYQTLQVGVRSIPLAATMSAFAGMVMALQFGYGLERFGAKLYIGQTTVTAILRELGPILTALVVGARVGAGIAAELGGMVVTEQVDAVRALGADPLQRLVAPRLFAVAVGLPILTVLADGVATAGSMLVATLQYGVSARLFLRGAYDFVTLGDFSSGIFKSLAFAIVIGGVACSAGLSATGGTEGVGRAATRAVVWGALGVLFTDVFLAKLLLTT
jgi:phospholipid/cholesterol/gamma-HCH transport system permease protein